MTTELFVERIFDDAGTPVICRFYAPVLQATGEYRCVWSIDWGQGARDWRTHGIDGVQALLLAMRVAHTELVESDSYKAGKLTYLEESALDLPGPFSLNSSTR